jgi:hypothetical protein
MDIESSAVMPLIVGLGMVVLIEVRNVHAIQTLIGKITNPCAYVPIFHQINIIDNRVCQCIANSSNKPTTKHGRNEFQYCFVEFSGKE